MARPLIRRRIKVAGEQRTDIDADLLLQALIQIAEDEAAQNSPSVDPPAPAPAETRINDIPTGSRRRPTPTAPSPNRPASRTTRARRAAGGAAGRSTSNKHRPTS